MSYIASYHIYLSHMYLSHVRYIMYAYLLITYGASMEDINDTHDTIVTCAQRPDRK